MLSFNQFNEFQGQFVGVKFDDRSNRDILSFAKKHQIIDVIPPEKLHCTLIYSRRFLDWFEITPIIDEYALVISFGLLNGFPVLFVESEYLTRKNIKLRLFNNASADFELYIPHVSLSYTRQDVDVEKINASFSEFEIHMIEEYENVLKINV